MPSQPWDLNGEVFLTTTFIGETYIYQCEISGVPSHVIHEPSVPISLDILGTELTGFSQLILR